VTRGIGILAALLSGSACTPDTPSALPDARVMRWMQCQECRSGELDSVVTMGPAAVTDLRRLLLDGPPLEFVTRVDSALRAPLSPLPGVPAVAPAPVTAIVLEDFRSMYRVRAAQALGAIGGSDARLALCEGRGAGFTRPDVHAAILAALAQVGGACPP
jgi:hypothetical protein